jgi:hypothetical protein
MHIVCRSSSLGACLQQRSSSKPLDTRQYARHSSPMALLKKERVAAQPPTAQNMHRRSRRPVHLGATRVASTASLRCSQNPPRSLNLGRDQVSNALSLFTRPAERRQSQKGTTRICVRALRSSLACKTPAEHSLHAQSHFHTACARFLSTSLVRSSSPCTSSHSKTCSTAQKGAYPQLNHRRPLHIIHHRIVSKTRSHGHRLLLTKNRPCTISHLPKLSLAKMLLRVTASRLPRRQNLRLQRPQQSTGTR